MQRKATKSSNFAIQRKLTIGASDDPLEREADRIADEVMTVPANAAINRAPPRIQRFTGSSTGKVTEAPRSVDRVLSSPGNPLEPDLRQDMESRFGYDFSQVRIHTDLEAEQSARDMNANAYTVENNVVFGAGQFSSRTWEGRRLIAHELTHVMQQLAPAEIGLERGDKKKSNLYGASYDLTHTSKRIGGATNSTSDPSTNPSLQMITKAQAVDRTVDGRAQLKIGTMSGIAVQRQLTAEEQHVSSAQRAGFLSMNSAATAVSFVADLNRARTAAAAERVVERFGRQLWETATELSSRGVRDDDRQLYWTRLMLTANLRQWTPSWGASAGSLQRLRRRLLLLLEQTSRGMTTSSFTESLDDSKRILISGFDPFGFQNQGDIRQSNLSGAAAIALDGETLSSPPLSARVEAVVFPVRYADFNEGMIENHLRPHLTGSQPPDLIMSISQGDQHFEFEEWAGRRRSSGSYLDNLGRLGGGSRTSPATPPGLTSGPEFLSHTIPPAMLSAMRGVVGRSSTLTEEIAVSDLPPGLQQERNLPRGPGANPGLAVEGSGGGFLSNEIFYRNSLLRAQTGSSVPIIHLHTPRLPPNASEAMRINLVTRIRQILLASLPYL
ncbi:eCIS core domain-containing protein [Nitrosospira briensis]|uniref:eCIS core domain-containing protein n=1 Tax=Nitrosospira briensis TaxID=35799 RepID=UPI0009427A49|nr:DUF4157 domain-containing protein [Nitrosospira briensis]